MANQILSVWGTIGSVVLAIFILLVMITVHEFGHYLAGKILRFKIDEFSIGFGPALFKHKSKKSGEVFALRLIPLGGFCAFAGEDGLDEGKEEGENLPEPFGEEFDAPSESDPEKMQEHTLEKSKAEELPTENKTAADEKRKRKMKKEKGYFTEKKPWQRIIVLVAGALMNYVLAVFLIIVCFFAYGQTMTAVYTAEKTDEIPAEFCLQDKDILLKADGKSIYLTTDIARAVNGKKAGDKVKFLISRVIETVTEVDPETGEEKFVKNIREEMTVEVMLRCDVKVKNSADLDAVWKAIGVEYSEEHGGFMLASSSYRFGFFETLGRSFLYSFKIAGSIFKIIGELLTGNLGITALGGPVTTIAMTSQVASASFRGFLEIAGFIGVNLAVFNLLPIPALDGSKVVFTVIEWIRKKPLSRKVEAVIHAVGFVLLLGFAVMVDILQFVL